MSILFLIRRKTSKFCPSSILTYTARCGIIYLPKGKGDKQMAKWDICLRDAIAYTIEAKTKGEAIKIALEFWEERLPEILCVKIKEDE